MPRRRDVIASTGVSVISAFAGCSSGSETISQTVTKKNIQATKSTTPKTTSDSAAKSVTYPEGWSADGISDVEAVQKTHYKALGTQPHTYSYNSIASDGGYNQANDFVIRLEPSSKEAYADRKTVYNRKSPDERWEKNTFRYVKGDKSYVKILSSKRQNRYEKGEKTFQDSMYQVDNDLLEYITPFKYSMKEVITKNGTTIIRYTSDELTDKAAKRIKGVYGDTASASVSVSEDGLLWSYDVNLGTVDKTEKFIDFSGQYTNLGKTNVDQPKWLGEAKDAISN